MKALVPTFDHSLMRTLLALAFLGAPAVCQDASPTLQILDIKALDDKTVRALVAVSDRQGRAVTGLSGVNFNSMIDQQPATTTRLERASASGKPLSVVLVMDISGSMKGPAIRGAIAGAQSFLDHLNDRDYDARLTCGDHARIV